MAETTNIPCLFSTGNTVLSSNLVPVSIVLLHDSINRKGTSISFEAIKAAAESIKNKPILAYITKNEDEEYDFAGHEIAVEITDDEDNPVKITYFERPVGIIPESTEIEFFEGEDGLMYMKCTGYIYENYSNETLDIIKRTDGKCVSAELRINSGTLGEDGVYIIETFDFLGVTILSDTRPPAMNENCRIELFEAEPTYKQFLSKALEDVKLYELNVKDLDLESNSKEEKSEVERTGEDMEEKDLKEKENEEGKEEIEETPENKKDIPDEKEEVEESIEEHTEEHSEGTEDVVSEETPNTLEMNFSIFDDMIGRKVYSLRELNEAFDEILRRKDNEISELHQYKRLHDSQVREAEIKEILTGIDFECEEFDICVKNAMEFEWDMAYFKKEIYAIYGRKMCEEKKKKKKDLNFSTDKIFIKGENANVDENTKTKNIATSPYANLFKDIL